MAVGERRPLEEARRIAEGFGRAIESGCERIEIAGSIRRCKEDVADLELVCIPRYRRQQGPKPDLFTPAPIWEINEVWDLIEAMGPEICEPVALQPIMRDPYGRDTIRALQRDPHWSRKRLRGSAYFKLFLPRSGFKVDLFMASPETWGVVFAIRTGSADFSKALVTRWTRVSGGHSREGQLYDRNGVLWPTPEERDVFDACKVRYIAPPLRIDGASLEPVGG